MRAVLGFDPDEYHYGPATSAIRAIMVEWADIDWFVASGAADDELQRLFREHNAIARGHAPNLFAERVDVRCVAGGWPEFIAWCKRVQVQTRWDWRFSVLKTLSNEHSKAHGWSLEAHAEHIEPGRRRSGDLFVRFNDANGKPTILWNGFLPALALEDLGRSPAIGSARFYLGHAETDVLCGIQWQLAEGHGDLSRNPFMPLLRCYRAGGYPFSLGRDTVVVFRFTADERALPTARLLPSRG